MTREDIRAVLRILQFPIALFFFNIAAIALFDVYHYWLWFDVPQHFLGGLAIAYAAKLTIDELVRRGEMERPTPVLLAVHLVAWTTTVAVLWEFHEYLVDMLMRSRVQAGIEDTMTDLFLGMSGSLIMAIYFARRGSA